MCHSPFFLTCPKWKSEGRSAVLVDRGTEGRLNSVRIDSNRYLNNMKYCVSNKCKLGAPFLLVRSIDIRSWVFTATKVNVH